MSKKIIGVAVIVVIILLSILIFTAMYFVNKDEKNNEIAPRVTEENSELVVSEGDMLKSLSASEEPEVAADEELLESLSVSMEDNVVEAGDSESINDNPENTEVDLQLLQSLSVPTN